MTSTHTFGYRLTHRALHIDYLRLRCGQEGAFADQLEERNDIRAYIAFSEWDVVVFIPSAELYPETLIGMYADKTLAGSIAGSAGFFNYLWDHPINHNWEPRILRPDKTISMLVSLRFTASFRRKLGIGAELLFCSYLQRQLELPELEGVSAVVAHSVGWNDATILLDAPPDHEDRLLSALTWIRYCTERDCMPDVSSRAGVIAATYSHLLGNLQTYSDKQLRFGDFSSKVKSARLLVRVNPDVEIGLRDQLSEMIGEKIPVRPEDERIGSELGHYNFSADIREAFNRQPGDDKDDAVRIIQGFREIVGQYLTDKHHSDEASFPETTTEITFREELSRVRLKSEDLDANDQAQAQQDQEVSENDTRTFSKQYKDRLEAFLVTLPAVLFKSHASMTAHRLAVLLGTIITYLDDPVRGSVVGHLCRFLDATFEDVLRMSDRAGKEDLCHILEYALHQATDGLTQFQHDANSLGLSGRGGYNRLIQAVEEFIDQLVGPFQTNLVPLITFGLRPLNDGTTLKYWVDLPFSTAFVPERWYMAYHDVARMCWQRNFEWRLDSYSVWQKFSQTLTPVTSHQRDEDRQEFVLARDVVEELFPNYLLLHVVCAGDPRMLDRLMVAKEFLTQPRPALIRSVTIRLVLDVLLMLHEKQHKLSHASSDDGDLKLFSAVKNREEARERSVAIAFEWWTEWWELRGRLTESDTRETMVREVAHLVQRAAKSLREVIESMKRAFSGMDAAQAFESTTNLISTPAFKADALKIVHQVIELLAVRGRDYSLRAAIPFAVFDPSAAEFGFALAKIRGMRHATERVSGDVARYRTAIEQGEVFAHGPEPPTLAHILAATGEAQRFNDDVRPRHPSMLSSLSSILSLWHSAVTRTPGPPREYPPNLLERLQDLRVVNREPF